MPIIAVPHIAYDPTMHAIDKLSLARGGLHDEIEHESRLEQSFGLANCLRGFRYGGLGVESS